jgi:hypothetical protein
MWIRLFLVALSSIAASGFSANGDEIMSRSVKVTEANWKEAPKYAFTRTDIKTDLKKDSEARKTYEVLMIEGSPFLKLIGVQGRTLAPEQAEEEQQRLQREVSRRAGESDRDRQKRVEKYNQDRNRDHALLTELCTAFDYTIRGERNLDNRQVIMLHGVPRPNYIPRTREAKVLAGMEVTFWIDKVSYQWRRVEAEVTAPVSLFGMIGKVNPGTRFILDQEPVSTNLWLPKRFQIQVRATALGFINQDSSREEIYADYRRQVDQETGKNIALKNPLRVIE